MTIESQTFDVSALIEYMQGNMGINPFNLYCQFTGKPIGRISPDELEPFLTGDIEEVADDLFVRIMASCRPSIHWNVMREDTLDKLAKSRPIETLAYLMNRLFQPHDWFKLPMARRMEDQHQRIKLYSFLETCGQVDRESLYAMLIEIDAKMNLSQQTIDLKVVEFMLDYDSAIKKIEAFYVDCLKRWERVQKHEEDQRRWLKGNTAAKPAFFRSFMEAKPESKTAVIKRAKKEKDMALDALFDSVMAETPNDSVIKIVDPVIDAMRVLPVAAKPVATPAPSAPAAKSFAGRAPSFLKAK